MILFMVFLVALLFGMVGRACAASRHRQTAGFWLGFWFGPIGCVVSLFLPMGESPFYKARPGMKRTTR